MEHSLDDTVSEKTTEELQQVTTASTKRWPRRSSKRNKIVEAAGNENIEVVTFLPSQEGELRDIPGFGQVLETKSFENGKVLRYPISTFGE